jgi:Trp operon repressor
MKYNKLIHYLSKLKQHRDYPSFLEGLFTPKELAELENRLTIVEELLKGTPQHHVAAKVGVGVATVTRGAKEIAKGNFKIVGSPANSWRKLAT